MTKLFEIPRHLIERRTSRASGPGGQHVNKSETRVEIRFHVGSSPWIPQEVRVRLLENERHRITDEGYLVLSSQRFRSQLQNENDCFEKLEAIVLKHWNPPKLRKKSRPTRASKERRLKQKKSHSEKKRQRRTSED